MGRSGVGKKENGREVSIWEGPLKNYKDLSRSVNIRAIGGRGSFPLVAGLIVEQGRFGRRQYWYPDYSTFLPLGVWSFDGGVLKSAEIGFVLERGQLKVKQRSDLTAIDGERDVGFKVRGVFDPRSGVVVRTWGGPLVDYF